MKTQFIWNFITHRHVRVIALLLKTVGIVQLVWATCLRDLACVLAGDIGPFQSSCKFKGSLDIKPSNIYAIYFIYFFSHYYVILSLHHHRHNYYNDVSL